MLKHLQSRDDWNEKGFAAKGFTLIELLVVIVIIGILAAVVVFAVGGITDRGKESACSIDKRTIRTAVEAYRAQEDNGGTPSRPSLTDLRDADFLSDISTNYTLGYDSNDKPVFTVISSGKCA